jgi:hypothetical protein
MAPPQNLGLPAGVAVIESGGTPKVSNSDQLLRMVAIMIVETNRNRFRPPETLVDELLMRRG